MTARSATVQAPAVRRRELGVNDARSPVWPKLPISDAVLAATLTLFALVNVIRVSDPVMAGALAAPATMSLTWRRSAPMTVLIISSASLFAEKLLAYPRTALSIAVLIALYTVAVTHRVLFTAVASSLLLMGAVACDVGRHGLTITDFDDQFFAYLMAIGAACALGYAVQLSRARVQLTQAREAENAGREQLVLQREQARIARELHDVIAHQVCVITALAAGADRLILTEPQRAKQVLNSIEAAGREALTEMRTLLRVLRTEAGELDQTQPGLAQLPSLVEQMKLAGLPARLSVEGEPRPLPVPVEAAAYRIVQEALTNSLKHAGPAHADVLVHYRSMALELDIRDDGPGIPASPKPGHGLIGMRERATLAGGCLLVGAGPAGGARVVAKLPITAGPH